MTWTTLFPIFQLILAAVSPALKQAALAELHTLADQNPNSLLLQEMISEAEKIIAAA